MLRAQKSIQENVERPVWKLGKDLQNGTFAQKLIQYEHRGIKHFILASTMAAVREHWHTLNMRSLVKRYIRHRNMCSVLSTKPYGANLTTQMPEFRIEQSHPFELTGVEFAGPTIHKLERKEDARAHIVHCHTLSYIVIFTCTVVRAIHLEGAKPQTAEEFIRKLNAFIAWKTRPAAIISDNGGAFKVTAEWIKIL